MAINRIPFNSLEILKLFLGSFDSECLDEINLRVLSQVEMSSCFRQLINPFLFLVFNSSFF